jgi:predicted nucleic acid-binding protein
VKDQSAGLVLDVSVVAAWAFEDEAAAIADVAADRLADGFALVPSLWHFETAHAMTKAVRRDRLRPDEATAFLDRLSAFDIRTDALPPNGWRLHAESLRYDLSAYDTAYLLLALDRGLPLATLDRALSEAAARAGVPLVA